MKIFSQFQVTPVPGTRFIEGMQGEAEEFFGVRLPEIPEGEGGDQNTYRVELHPGLRKASRDFIAHVYTLLTERGTHDLTPRHSSPGDLGPDPYSRLGSLLSEILSHTLDLERRQGLLNLFWLAHSKEMSEVIEEFFSQSGVKGYIRYQIHPLVSGFYRNVHTTLMRRLKSLRPEVLRYNLGRDFNAALIESMIDDQLPLTEPDISRINFSQILVDQNKRFHIGLKEFKEVSSLCRERIRDILREKEEPFYGLIRRSLPSIPPEHFDDEKAIGKIFFHSQVLHALLRDYAVLVPRFQKSSVLKSFTGEGKWAELFTGYCDLVEAVKRTEVIDILRRGITVLPPGLDDTQIRRFFAEGRLYRFHESAEVLNTARKVTVLFADLRGFTKTSEGGISEGELVSSLYVIFDALVSLVEQYHGKIDKFTGDGVMITFGVTHLTPDDELNALRTALAIQGLLAELRHAGRTRFHMGMSIHTGRVQVAHFLVDETTVDVTVIGRSVNIAGRLSGSGEKEREETSEVASSRVSQGGQGRVRVNEEGTLYNWGIAVSQDTVDEIVKVLPLDPIAGEGKRGYRFRDPRLQKNVLLEHVGDAKFKGIERAIPVYECRVSA